MPGDSAPVERRAATAGHLTVRAGDLSVVVCARSPQRWTRTQKVLLALQHQIEPVGQVVLVVDGDEALATARAEYPELTMVANPFCHGLDGARDAGAALCTGAITAFLEDDTLPAPDWSCRLAASYDGPEVVAVAGRIEPEWPGGRRPGWWPAEFDWVVGCSRAGLPRGRSPIDSTVGTAISLRTPVLRAVDGFGFGSPGERDGDIGSGELAVFLRARRCRSGDTILFEPAAVARKVVAPSRTTLRWFLRRCYAEGAARAALPRGGPAGRRLLPGGAARGLLQTDARRAVVAVLGILAAGLGYVSGTRR